MEINPRNDGRQEPLSWSAVVGRTARTGGFEPDSQRSSFGDEELLQLDQLSPRELLDHLGNQEEDVKALLEEEMREDRVSLILNIFSKISQVDLVNGLNNIRLLVTFVHSSFLLSNLKIFLTNLLTTTSTHDEYVANDVKNVCSIAMATMRRLPSHVMNLVPMTTTLDFVWRKLKAAGRFQIAELDALLEELMTYQQVLLVANLEEKKEQGGHVHIFDPQDLALPPEDFREMTIHPTLEDINRELTPFLRRNIVTGSYQDLEHYLDVHFRLLREDLVGPFVEGVLDWVDHLGQRGHRSDNIRVYNDVRITNVTYGPQGAQYNIQFNVDPLRNVNWKTTKRLIHGSLVCLTSDDLCTLYLATVCQSTGDSLEEGQLSVSFVQDYPELRDVTSEQKYVMIEPCAFFEAYKHVLRSLQNMNVGNFPFQEYLVYCVREVNKPRYLFKAQKYDMRAVVEQNCRTKFQPATTDKESKDLRPKLRMKVDVVSASRNAEALSVVNVMGAASSWPSHTTLLLDPSQHTALRAALRHELVLIQGPPGTGKTFLGLKIVRTLIQNCEVWNRRDVRRGTGDSPILLVCYTNHALDQFLEGIANFIDGGIVRVGGRCKNESLKQYVLGFEMRKACRLWGVGKAKYECYERMKNIEKQIKQDDKELRKVTDGRVTDRLHEKVAFHPNYKKRFESFEYHQDFDSVNAWDFQHRFRYWLGLTEKVPVQDVPEQDHKKSPKKHSKKQKNKISKNMPFTDSRRIPPSGSNYQQNDVIDIAHEENWASDQQVVLDCHTEEERYFQQGRKNADDSQMREKQDDFYTGAWQHQGYTYELREDWQDEIHAELSRPDMMSDDDVNRVMNVWDLTIEQRWNLYRFWLALYKEDLLGAIRTWENRYQQQVDELQLLTDAEDRNIIAGATVVGMTTTGAAKNRRLLQQIQPRIVIVEEAAEVLEAHIITALNPGCQHLILIGDHKQLRPSPNSYTLAKDFNLDISLFERLIKNNLPSTILEKQHRMRPDISNLLRHIYPDLQDDESVLKYDDIQGVGKNMFFINHHEPESGESELKSKLNEHEARYITALCRYLLLQGYKPDQITVLVAYTGQLLFTKNLMPRAEFEGVRLTAVDNYQGEENDIVILSLVRSNDRDIIGFLKEDNRVCVALSRAKKGFYAIGNFDMYERKNSLWGKMVTTLKKGGNIGAHLGLMCVNHPQTVIHARTAEDFKDAPEGGCKLPCDARLDCGHTCRLLCHGYDRDHVEYKCQLPCQRSCPRGHRCCMKCWRECRCDVPVTKTIPGCGHTQNVPCYLPPEEYTCRVPCEHVLTCGHVCDDVCGATVHTRFCLQRCKKTCLLGHQCRARCSDCAKECPPCPVYVHRKLLCGHVRMMQCHEDPHMMICESRCEETLRCGHQCQETCAELCTVDCREHVDLELSCGHSIIVDCFDSDKRFDCQQPITKTLPCGHKTEAPCHISVKKIVCQALVEKSAPCGHNLRVACSSDVSAILCDVPTPRQLKCGHKLDVKCHVNTEEVRCRVQVDQRLPCGHLTIVRCSDASEAVDCRMNVEKRAKCGHTHVVPCHVTEKDIRCDIKIERALKCGHKSEVSCYVKDDVRCDVKVEKSLPCGHTGHVPCHMTEGDAKCRHPVKKKLKCGHAPMIPCYVTEINAVCKVKDHKKLDCGHKKTVECHKNPADISCDAPCKVQLKCGHKCTGVCGKCKKRGEHNPCKERRCSRKLLCGHPCQGACAVPCPPCRARCMRRCAHMLCQKQCGEVCNPCTSRCAWACPHYTCSRQCHEPCDRPRCDAPCDVMLPCGHTCIGLCGEVCPYLCRVCNEEKLTKQLVDDVVSKRTTARQDSTTARFVQLHCGHVMEVNIMDKLMDEENNGPRKLRLKTCPGCRKPLLRSGRYGNMIKMTLKSIDRAKEIRQAAALSLSKRKSGEAKDVPRLALGDWMICESEHVYASTGGDDAECPECEKKETQGGDDQLKLKRRSMKHGQTHARRQAASAR